MHQNYIYNNLKIGFKPYGIENEKKIQIKIYCNYSSPSKSSSNYSHELSLIIKTIQLLIITKLKTLLIILPSFLTWTLIQTFPHPFLSNSTSCCLLAQIMKWPLLRPFSYTNRTSHVIFLKWVFHFTKLPILVFFKRIQFGIRSTFTYSTQNTIL
jgi:hypothetical protein